MAKKKNSKDQKAQDASVPVVFTVQQDDKTFWVLAVCSAEKIDILETSYALMLTADSEINLESVLKNIGAEVRDYGDTEDIVVNGQVIGQTIPDHVKKIASRVIGEEQADPELDTHPETYMPGNDNSP